MVLLLLDAQRTALTHYTYFVARSGSVLLLDQLLGTLDLVQRDALGRAARLPDALGMSLALRFALFVPRRWYK